MYKWDRVFGVANLLSWNEKRDITKFDIHILKQRIFGRTNVPPRRQILATTEASVHSATCGQTIDITMKPSPCLYMKVKHETSRVCVFERAERSTLLSQHDKTRSPGSGRSAKTDSGSRCLLSCSGDDLEPCCDRDDFVQSFTVTKMVAADAPLEFRWTHQSHLQLLDTGVYYNCKIGFWKENVLRELNHLTPLATALINIIVHEFILEPGRKSILLSATDTWSSNDDDASSSSSSLSSRGVRTDEYHSHCFVTPDSSSMLPSPRVYYLKLSYKNAKEPIRHLALHVFVNDDDSLSSGDGLL